MAREAVKTFTKVLDLTAATEGIVECRDCSGNLIKCNYAHIAVAEDVVNFDSWFWVQPSGYGTPNNSRYADPDLNPSATTLAGSGAGGSVGRAELVISTQGGERFEALKLFNAKAATVTFAVTYGVRKSVNARGDEQTAPGD